jgi:hypothetical protein
MPPRKMPKQQMDFSQISIERMDDYVEKLYDDQVENKVEASKSFLYLCYSHENMVYMLDHETLFGVISRTLRESFKESLDMTLYLLNVFQSYSNFTDFHQFLMTNQIGDTTLKIIEHETKRY